MSNVEFRTIEHEDETLYFLEKFKNYTGVQLPLEYARNSKIVGVFSNNRLSGGYMLVTKPEFRSLSFIPNENKMENDFFLNEKYEMMEVNGLWIGASIKNPKDQFKVWIKLVCDIFLAKKKYLLLMCDSRNENIKNLHSLTKPDFLYQGSPYVMAGQESVGSIRVSYTTRWKVILGIPAYISQLRSRQQRVSRVVNRKLLIGAK